MLYHTRVAPCDAVHSCGAFSEAKLCDSSKFFCFSCFSRRRSDGLLYNVLGAPCRVLVFISFWWVMGSALVGRYTAGFMCGNAVGNRVHTCSVGGERKHKIEWGGRALGLFITETYDDGCGQCQIFLVVGTRSSMHGRIKSYLGSRRNLFYHG